MDKLRRDGRVSAIGLGVNEFEVCEQSLEYGDWDCFLLAGRYTLLEQRSLDSFLPKCIDRGCSVIIGGAYNSGILATGVRGKGPWHYDYKPAPQYIVTQVAAIEAVCEEFEVPLAAAALQFSLGHPAVASVIPGIGNVRRIAQTLDYFSLEIPTDFWERLKECKLIREDVPLLHSSGVRGA